MPDIRETSAYQEIRYVLNYHVVTLCMWLTICQMPDGTERVLCVWCVCDLFFFASHPVYRCQRLPCSAVSGVGVARQCSPPMPWHCTSNRSPWLMGSPPRRLNSNSSNNNSSSFQASQANSSLTPHRQTETGRLFTAAALVFTRAAPPSATRMVRSSHLITENYFYCQRTHLAA